MQANQVAPKVNEDRYFLSVQNINRALTKYEMGKPTLLNNIIDVLITHGNEITLSRESCIQLWTFTENTFLDSKDLPPVLASTGQKLAYKMVKQYFGIFCPTETPILRENCHFSLKEEKIPVHFSGALFQMILPDFRAKYLDVLSQLDTTQANTITGEGAVSFSLPVSSLNQQAVEVFKEWIYEGSSKDKSYQQLLEQDLTSLTDLYFLSNHFNIDFLKIHVKKQIEALVKALPVNTEDEFFQAIRMIDEEKLDEVLRSSLTQSLLIVHCENNNYEVDCPNHSLKTESLFLLAKEGPFGDFIRNYFDSLTLPFPLKKTQVGLVDSYKLLPKANRLSVRTIILERVGAYGDYEERSKCAKLVNDIVEKSPNFKKITLEKFAPQFNLNYFSLFSSIKTACIEVRVTELESDFTKPIILPEGLVFLGSTIEVNLEYHKNNVKNNKYDFSHFDNFLQLPAIQNHFIVDEEQIASIKQIDSYKTKIIEKNQLKDSEKKVSIYLKRKE